MARKGKFEVDLSGVPELDDLLVALEAVFKQTLKEKKENNGKKRTKAKLFKDLSAAMMTNVSLLISAFEGIENVDNEAKDFSYVSGQAFLEFGKNVFKKKKA